MSANTIKLWTVIYFALGAIVPLWPVSLPLFWWLAYRSYRSGVPVPTISLHELERASELHKSGLITSGELDRIKSSTTGLNRM